MMSSLEKTAHLEGITLARLLQQNAQRFGEKRTALRVKRLGIWQESSWQEYFHQVKAVALGFSALGATSGDNVAILSGNSPTALHALIGAGAAGCTPICLHRESTAAEVREILSRFRVKYVVAENQEQVDKILEVTPLQAGLKNIIYCNPRGMSRYREDILIPLDRFCSAGLELEAGEQGCFERLLAAGKSDDTALICTTSGTAGPLKGALLTHSNILSVAQAFVREAGMKESDELVSFLPLSWFGEQMLSVAAALLAGLTVNFPESPETVMADLREIGPHIIFAPPQVWEGIAASVQVRMMESTPFKKFMFNTFMALGKAGVSSRLSGESPQALDRIKSGLAHVALMRALLDRLGLARVRVALTGGSAMGEDVFTFFHTIGVRLKQVYGLTEISGVACMHRNEKIKFGTVGTPLPGTEISFSASGEILLKSSGLFKGYFADNNQPAETLPDGWLHTGDAGYLDPDGQLVVLDRSADIFSAGDGSKVSPQAIEGKLKFSPYIAETLLIGANRPFISALICINGRVTGKWAADNKIPFSSYSDLASKPEVYDFIALELTKANDKLPQNAKVSKFTILYKELDPDDEELTRTGKLRREFVRTSYHNVIEALYSGAEFLDIDRTIDLQDGRSARIQSRILFRSLPQGGL
jgi:long-chain acyl-CoA synthetase